MDINSILPQIIVWAVTGFLCFVAGRFCGAFKALKAMLSGMRSLLRNALMETHRRCVIQQKYCEVVDKEVTERNYIAYHDLGGNGTGTRLYEEIMALPIKED